MTDSRDRNDTLADELSRAHSRIAELEAECSELKERVETYGRHFSIANDVIFTYDTAFTLLSVSPNVGRILGYGPEELVGRPFPELGLLDDRDLGRALENALQVLSGATIHATVYRFIARDGRTMSGEVSGIPLIRDGNISGVISVARDITDRVVVEQAYRAEAEKYLTHFSLTDDVLYTIDDRLVLTSVSPSVENALGYRPDELIGKRLQDIGVIHPDDTARAAEDSLRMLSGEMITASIYRFFNRRGEVRFGEIRGIPLTEGGRITEVVSVARDVTGRIKAQEELRKHRDHLEELVGERTAELRQANESLMREMAERMRTEEALRASEEKYRLLVEHASDGIFIAQEGMLKYVNPKTVEISGYSREELTSRPFDFLIHPEDLPVVSDRHSRRMAGEELPEVYSFRILNRYGQTRWVEVNAVPVMWEGRTAALSFLVDVTERRHAEETLRASEAKYRMLYDGMEDGFVIGDLTGRILECNKAFLDLTGYGPEELRTLTYMDFTPPRWHAYEAGILQGQTMEKGYSEPYEKEYVRRDGSVLPVELRTYLMRDAEGRPAGMWAIVRDVSTRKAAELALRMSERRFRDLAENTSDLVWETDENLRFTYMNRKIYEHMGCGPEDRIGKTLLEVIPPGDAERMAPFFRSLVEHPGPFQDLEYTAVHSDGSPRIRQASGVPIYDEAGRHRGYRGITRDITARRRIEDELRESEAKYRFLAEKMTDIVWTMDLGLRTTYVSTSVTVMLGYTPEERVRQDPRDQLTEESYGRVMGLLAAELERDGREGVDPDRMVSIEVEYRHKDGSTVWMENVISGIRDDSGSLVGLHGVSRDIRDRKRDEQRILASERKFSAVFHSSPVPMVVSQPEDGLIIDCNLSCERWSGFSREELIGHTTLEIGLWLDAYDRECFMRGVQEKSSRDASEIMFRVRDGTIRDVLLSSRLMDVDGKRLMLTQVVDITERKKTQEMIRASERKFSAAFNASPAPMVITSPGDGRIIDANDACQNWSGYSREEAVGRTTTELGFWDDPGMRSAFSREVMEKGMVDAMEMRYITRGGQVREVLHSARLIEIDGEPCFLSHIQDITEKKQAERALVESEERLRGIAENFPGVVFQFYARDNGEQGVYYISGRTWEVLGLGNDADRFLAEALACIAPEDRERYHSTIQEAVRWEAPWDSVFRFIKPGGDEIYVRGVSKPVRRDRELVFSGVLFDITTQKLMDEELKRHRDRLEDMVLSRTSELTDTLKRLTCEMEVRKRTEVMLRSREMELQNRGVELEEMNAALKVLLKQREEDRSTMEMNIISNMKTFVLPHLERLHSAPLDENLMKSVSMIASHIEEITSPFTRKISSEFLGLTPTEIQVASLIREGKSSKDIARLMNISLNTVHTYRYNIRRKTGLKRNKVNLRSYLRTLE